MQHSVSNPVTFFFCCILTILCLCNACFLGCSSFESDPRRPQVAVAIASENLDSIQLDGLASDVAEAVAAIRSEIDANPGIDWLGTYIAEDFEDNLVLTLSPTRAAHFFLSNSVLIEQGQGRAKFDGGELELDIKVDAAKNQGRTFCFFNESLVLVPRDGKYYLVPLGSVHSFFILMREDYAYASTAFLCKRDTVNAVEQKSLSAGLPSKFSNLVDLPPITATLRKVLESSVDQTKNRCGEEIVVTRVLLDSAFAAKMYKGMRLDSLDRAASVIVREITGKHVIAEQRTRLEFRESTLTTEGEEFSTPTVVRYDSDLF